MKNFLALSLILTVTMSPALYAKESRFVAHGVTSGMGRETPKGYLTPEADAEETADDVCAEAIETCQKATGKECVEVKRKVQFTQAGYSLSPAELTCWASEGGGSEPLRADETFWRQLLGGR